MLRNLKIASKKTQDRTKVTQSRVNAATWQDLYSLNTAFLLGKLLARKKSPGSEGSTLMLLNQVIQAR